MEGMNSRGNSHLHEVILTDRHYINKLPQLKSFMNYLENSPRPPRQNFFMLIRPRGFGLSLANEAIESLFSRDELLMDNIDTKTDSSLNLDELGHYSVLHFSFSKVKATTYNDIVKILYDALQSLIWEHHVKIKTDTGKDLRMQMLELIRQITDKDHKQIVVLFDNYDVPIMLISRLENELERQKCLALYLEMLNAFRQAGDRVKFCLLTGHVKFSLSSSLSEGLPHVIDLSFADIAAELTGFTIEEIKNTYGEDLARIAPQQGITVAEYLDCLEHCYGGYVFSDKMVKVLCPFSVTRALDNDGELYAYSCDNNYNFLQVALQKEKPDLSWLIEKDGQDMLFLEEVSFKPEDKEFGPLLVQQGLVSVNKVTFADREHSLSWRYRYGFTNVEMRRIFQILTGISHPSLRELPINTRVYDAGEEEYLIKAEED